MTLLLFSDIKRKCSKTDCKNLEKEVGEFDRLFFKYFFLIFHFNKAGYFKALSNGTHWYKTVKSTVKSPISDVVRVKLQYIVHLHARKNTGLKNTRNYVKD